MRSIVSGSSAALVLTAAIALASPLKAQNLPWPNDPPPAGGATAPWPSSPPQGAVFAPPAGPGAMGPGAMGPGAGPMTPVPPQAAGPGGGAPPCLEEFGKLQAETDKQAKAAKAASTRKAPREEMCKILQAFEKAIGKWANYAKANVASCGIPDKIASQLKAGHANIAKNASQVCAVAGGPAQPTPTLSDALGTTRTPTLDATKPSTATGTLNTLTGTLIGQ